MVENKTTIELTDDEAKLFLMFQKNYQLIAHILGTLDTLRLNDLRYCNVQMDFDPEGLITHTAITKHYKKLSTV